MHREKIEEVITHFIAGWTDIESVRVEAFTKPDGSIDVHMSFHGGREAVKELAGLPHYRRGFYVKPDGFYRVSNIAVSPRDEGLSFYDFTLTPGKQDLTAPPPPILVY